MKEEVTVLVAHQIAIVAANRTRRLVVVERPPAIDVEVLSRKQRVLHQRDVVEIVLERALLLCRSNSRDKIARSDP